VADTTEDPFWFQPTGLRIDSVQIERVADLDDGDRRAVPPPTVLTVLYLDCLILTVLTVLCVTGLRIDNVFLERVADLDDASRRAVSSIRQSRPEYKTVKVRI